ncbi:MAG: Bug family tripartite tricarboxylate transporter substrate binding protein [Xanthobacteraceae bacterium]
MRLRFIRRAMVLLGALAVIGDVEPAMAYPDRPVRIVVPFAPGGLNDTVARLIQPYLEKSLGQPVIVDNRPGASGIIGADAVAKAPPDGHMLLMVASSYTVIPATNSKVPYDSARDLQPIAMVGKNPLLFVVAGKLAAKTLPEFVALAKASPGKLNYASPGAASQNHLVIELFSKAAGIKLQHVPYRGGAPAITATVAGETELTVISPLASLPQIEAGNLRALAAGSLTRDPQFPDLPTVAESGFPGFEAIQWVGLLTTAGTPKPIVEKLNAEVNRALRDPDLIPKLAAQGVSPAGGGVEEFQTLIAREIRNWAEVARTANIKTD